MRNHTVEIADKTGNVFKLQVSTPSSRTRAWGAITGTSTRPQGTWRTIDKGFILVPHGKTFGTQTYNSRDLTTRDIQLLGNDGRWGIELFEYEDWTGVNAVGTGTVLQSWVLNMSVGKFSWAIID